MQECPLNHIRTVVVVDEVSRLSNSDCESHYLSLTSLCAHGRESLNAFTTGNEYHESNQKLLAAAEVISLEVTTTKQGSTLSDCVKWCENDDQQRYSTTQDLPKRLSHPPINLYLTHTKQCTTQDHSFSCNSSSSSSSICGSGCDSDSKNIVLGKMSNLETAHFLHSSSNRRDLSGFRVIGDSCHQEGCTDSGGGSSGQNSGSSGGGSNKKQKTSSSSSHHGSSSSSGQHGTGVGSGRSRSGSSDSSDDNGDDDKRPRPLRGRKEPKAKSDFADDDDEATDSADEGRCDDTPRCMTMDYSPQSQNGSQNTHTSKDPPGELPIFDSNKNASDGGGRTRIQTGSGLSSIAIESVGYEDINMIGTSAVPHLASPVNMSVGYGIPAAPENNSMIMMDKTLPDSNPDSRIGTPTLDSPRPLLDGATIPRTPLMSPKIPSVTQVMCVCVGVTITTLR